MTPKRLGLIAAAVVCLFAFAAWGLEFPQPTGAVNDFAKVIDQKSRDSMEALAREVLQKTGTALVVATFSTIGDRDIESFANELYSAWGIGKKGEDKGVLIMIALKERRFRIETGYGVEGVLPDGKLGRIRDEYILPYFKKGQYGAGFENGLKAVAAVLADDAGVTLTGRPKPEGVKPGLSGKSGLGTFILIAFLVLLVFGNRRRRGGRGGILPWIILGSILGSGRGHGGGGSFGGFGGGFGGFGGGMSGGGGVSGSW